MSARSNRRVREIRFFDNRGNLVLVVRKVGPNEYRVVYTSELLDVSAKVRRWFVATLRVDTRTRARRSRRAVTEVDIEGDAPYEEEAGAEIVETSTEETYPERRAGRTRGTRSNGNAFNEVDWA